MEDGGQLGVVGGGGCGTSTCRLGGGEWEGGRVGKCETRDGLEQARGRAHVIAR